MKRLLIVNGPNLNLLGSREPDVYGTATLADIEAMVRRRAAELGCDVINPGALTHYSYALYDCLRALAAPVVEVHISNLHARVEGFRTRDVTAPAAVGVIQGLGPRGYLMAMEYLVDRDE
jgi:3-dehydroquinate dehydratase-2